MDRGEERILEAIRISLRDARGEVRKLGFQLLKQRLWFINGDHKNMPFSLGEILFCTIILH
jgi:hypothetical protein